MHLTPCLPVYASSRSLFPRRRVCVPPVSAASESAPLRRIVRRLVEAVDPERILLFGSRAKGTASGESDLDLCVIAEMEGDRRERRNRLHELVRPEHDGPVDVLTFTPAEFAREKHLLNSVTYLDRKSVV